MGESNLSNPLSASTGLRNTHQQEHERQAEGEDEHERRPVVGLVGVVDELRGRAGDERLRASRLRGAQVDELDRGALRGYAQRVHRLSHARAWPPSVRNAAWRKSNCTR